MFWLVIKDDINLKVHTLKVSLTVVSKQWHLTKIIIRYGKVRKSKISFRTEQEGVSIAVVFLLVWLLLQYKDLIR